MKITASTSPSTTRLAIWTSPPTVPDSRHSTSSPTLSINSLPVELVATSWNSARRSRLGEVGPLPGSRDLLARLNQQNVPWAIATSGNMRTAGPSIELLGVRPKVVITRDDVAHAKPDPDLFLAAAARLGVDITSSIVFGDSVWDLLAAQRARSLGVGLLSGGYGREELQQAGAYRVYEDPRDLLLHLDEVGVREPLG